MNIFGAVKVNIRNPRLTVGGFDYVIGDVLSGVCKLLENSFDVVYEEYRKLGQHEEPDLVAKGKKLVEILKANLKAKLGNGKSAKSARK